jgi:hypothetical protein
MCGAHMEQVYRAVKVTEVQEAQPDTYYAFSAAGALVAGCSSFGFSACSSSSSSAAQVPPARDACERLHKALCYNPATGHMLIRDDNLIDLVLLRGSSSCSIGLSHSKQFAISPDGEWLLVCTALGQVRLISTSCCSPDAAAAAECLEQHQLLDPDSLRDTDAWCCCFSGDSRWASRVARRERVPLHHALHAAQVLACIMLCALH